MRGAWRPRAVRRRSLALVAAACVAWGCAGGRSARQDSAAYLNEARALLAEGRGIEAVERLRNGLGRDRRHREGRLLLAQAYRSLHTIEARAEAEKILADLCLIFPDDPSVLRATADLHVEQGYTSKGRREYERVLAIDPVDTAAHFALGRLHEAQWLRAFREEDYDAAKRCFERALEIDSSLAEPRVRLALGEMEHGHTAGAIEQALRIIETHPEGSEGHLLLGSIYARLEDYEAARAEFDRVDPAAEFLAAAEGIRFLMNEGGWYRYLDRKPWEREADALGRWMESDPTPASGMNERRVCHEARVYWSDLLYGSPRLGVRGWETAPGEMYIRYGPPVRKEYVSGSVSGSGLVPPTWIFTYNAGGAERVVVFEDLVLNGRFYFPMSRTPTTADFLRERYPNEVPLPARAGEMAYAARAWQFRGPEGATRLEYYVDAPEPPAPGGLHPRQWGDLTREVVAFDSLWRAVDRRRENFADGVELHSESGYRAVSGTKFLLAPGSYRIASEVEDLRSGAKGGRREDVRVEDFRGTRLRLSEIVLGRAAGHERPAGPAGRERPGFAPEVTGEHPADAPLEVYFEVYDLTPDLTGFCRWRGAYTLFPEGQESAFKDRAPRSLFGRAPKLPPHVTQSFDERTPETDHAKRLRIELRSLPPGGYILELHVTDLNTGIEAHRQTSFRLLGDGR